MKRAARRHATRTKFARLLNELFAVNTGHESKDETRKLIYTNGHREQTGRNGINLSIKRPTLTVKMALAVSN
jgi:hypothetical protein